jgi:hypothetical protein
MGKRSILVDMLDASISCLPDSLNADKEAALVALVDDHLAGFGENDAMGIPELIGV